MRSTDRRSVRPASQKQSQKSGQRSGQRAGQRAGQQPSLGQGLGPHGETALADADATATPIATPISVGERPLTEELAQTFFELLIRHRAGFQHILGETGLSALQLHVLQNLGEGTKTMRELASASFCEPSALTGVVDKLEARGLLSRRASTEDRRSKQVSLTRSGAAFRRRLLARFQSPAPWMMALSQPDQQQLLEILQRAVVLAQPPSEPPSSRSSGVSTGAPASSRSSGRASGRSGRSRQA